MATAKSIKRSYRQQSIFRFAVIVAVLVLLNVIGSFFYARLDLTADKRFTLNDSTIALMQRLDDRVFVKVHLTGELPSDWKRLEISTRDMLNQLRGYSNGKLDYLFEDPLEGKSQQELDTVYREMMAKGLDVRNISTSSSTSYAKKIVIPGATVSYRGRETAVNLYEGQGVTPEGLNQAVSQIENKFSSSIHKLSLARMDRVGFVRGQGELPLYTQIDFVKSLSDYYQADTLVLQNVLRVPDDFKVLVIAKPTQPFDERDKFKIDQFIMRGGAVLWLVDALAADMDSLQVLPTFTAMDLNLKLDDLLFTYGVRVNPVLLMDLQCNPVPLLVNYIDNQPEFRLFPCYYFPVFTPPLTNHHAIVKEIDAVHGMFTATIDTAQVAGVKKTVLMSSSRNARQAYTPWQVDFRLLKSRPDSSLFKKGPMPVAVLLEGNFTSAYRNRVSSEFKQTLNDSLKTPFAEQGQSKQIVIADGDMIANDFTQKGPVPLGLYKYTGERFANKNFLLNCVDYLSGHPERIATRSKDVKLRLLDTEKVTAERTKWQLINVALPVLLVLVFGVVYAFVRLRRYAA